MTEEKQVATESTPTRRKRAEPFALLVQGGDTYQSLDEAMEASLAILGKIIADLARRDWEKQIEGEDDGQEKEGVGILSGADGGSVLAVPGGDGELSPPGTDS